MGGCQLACVRAYAWVLHTLQGDLWAFWDLSFFFPGLLAVIFLPFRGGVLYEAFLLYFVTLSSSFFLSISYLGWFSDGGFGTGGRVRIFLRPIPFLNFVVWCT